MTADYHFKYSNELDLDIGWISDSFHRSKYFINGEYHADVITIPVEEISEYIKNGDISVDFGNKLLSIADYSRVELHKYYEEDKRQMLEDEKQSRIQNYHDKCFKYELYDYICAYCGRDLYETGHIDRIIPGKKGGKYKPDNVVLSCPSCNSKKGGRTPEEAEMVILYGGSNIKRLNRGINI